MRKLIPALLLLLLASCTIMDAVEPKKNIVYVEFSNKMNSDDLTAIKSYMAEIGISLDYTKLSFDESHRLKAIAFNVDCHDGFKGRGGTDYLADHQIVSFLRDYRQGARVPFAINIPPQRN